MSSRIGALEKYLENRNESLPYCRTAKSLGKIFKPLGGLFARGDISHVISRHGISNFRFPQDFEWGRPGSPSCGYVFFSILEMIANTLCLQFEHFDPVKENPFEPPQCRHCVYFGKQLISKKENRCRCARNVCEELYCSYSGIAFDVLHGIFWEGPV